MNIKKLFENAMTGHLMLSYASPGRARNAWKAYLDRAKKREFSLENFVRLFYPNRKFVPGEGVFIHRMADPVRVQFAYRLYKQRYAKYNKGIIWSIYLQTGAVVYPDEGVPRNYHFNACEDAFNWLMEGNDCIRDENGQSGRHQR